MYKIGVDIGGTNIALGLADDNLNMVMCSSVPFSRAGGGERTAAAIYNEARLLLDKAGAGMEDVECLGAVVPGGIDPSGGIVLDAFNLGFHNEPLKARLERLFPGTPVFLANDADGAALAELHKGALIGCQTAALITLGTGMGGGLILNGRMFRGGRNNGVELGHMLLVNGGQHCTCGNMGCAEAYCSASALAREGRLAMERHGDGLLIEKTGENYGKLTAKLVMECAAAGDRAAMEAFEKYVDNLGSAAASLFNLLDCQRIAIGGGVSGAGEFLFAALRANAYKKCFFENHGDIVPAALGNDAGIIGAAMLMKNDELRCSGAAKDN